MEVTKVTIDNIDKIKKKLAFFYEKYECGYREEFLDVNINDTHIAIDFPKEIEGEVKLSVSDFLRCATNFDSVKVENNSIYRNHFITQQLTTEMLSYTDCSNAFKVKYVGDNYTVQLVQNPFLIGCVNTLEENYGKHIAPCSNYEALQIKYKDKRTLSSMEEYELLANVLHHMNRQVDFEWIVRFRHMPKIDYWYVYEDETLVEDIVHIKDTRIHSAAYNKFNISVCIPDLEIRFFSFYKLIEYVYDTSLSSEDKVECKQDEDKCSCVINKFVAKTFLCSLKYPQFIVNHIKQRIGISCKQDLSITMLKENFCSVVIAVTKCLYQTRCNIAHGGDRTKSSNLICPYGELDKLNEFVAKICGCIVDKLYK